MGRLNATVTADDDDKLGDNLIIKVKILCMCENEILFRVKDKNTCHPNALDVLINRS